MKVLAMIVVVAGVVFGLAFLGIWWVLPRKHVRKKPDGSAFIWRDRNPPPDDE